MLTVRQVLSGLFVGCCYLAPAEAISLDDVLVASSKNAMDLVAITADGNKLPMFSYVGSSSVGPVAMSVAVESGHWVIDLFRANDANATWELSASFVTVETTEPVSHVIDISYFPPMPEGNLAYQRVRDVELPAIWEAHRMSYDIISVLTKLRSAGGDLSKPLPEGQESGRGVWAINLPNIGSSSIVFHRINGCRLVVESVVHSADGLGNSEVHFRDWFSAGVGECLYMPKKFRSSTGGYWFDVQLVESFLGSTSGLASKVVDKGVAKALRMAVARGQVEVRDTPSRLGIRHALTDGLAPTLYQNSQPGYPSAPHDRTK